MADYQESNTLQRRHY